MQLTWELKKQASFSSKSTPTFAAEKNPQQDDKPSLGAFRDVMSGSPTNINVFLTLLEDENKLANHSTASRTQEKWRRLSPCGRRRREWWWEYVQEKAKEMIVA